MNVRMNSHQQGGRVSNLRQLLHRTGHAVADGLEMGRDRGMGRGGFAGDDGCAYRFMGSAHRA